MSYYEAMNDPVFKAKMEKEEATLKMKMDEREITESKQEIKAIWLEKLRLDSEL